MFTVKNNECVGFESRWVVKKVSQVNSTQTTEFSTKEAETNTKRRENIEIQTADNEENKKETTNEVDMERLAKWLKSIFPQVTKELNKIENCKAFKNYKLIGDINDINYKIIQTIDLNPPNKKQRVKLRVSALSWNCTGKILGVSCFLPHKTWCPHEGAVSLFVLNRSDELCFKMKLTTDNCIMFLKFHPNLPFILTSSTFSGEILIWDIQLKEELIIKVNAHEQCISCLDWISHLDSSKYFLLASSSLDGIMKLWNFDLNKPSLVIKEKYKIKSPFCPNILSEPITKADVGIICFSFSKFIPDMFVVGVEGGMIAQCSMLGTTMLKGSTEQEPLSDPVFKYFAPLKGEIISIKFSPNNRDMFMTNGTDGEIRIYLINQEDPAKIIFLKNPLNVINWIPYQDKLITGCGSKGTIEIFNITKEKPMENNIEEKVSSQNFVKMEICQGRTDMVAVGTENGNLHLWNVPWLSFSEPIKPRLVCNSRGFINNYSVPICI